MFDIGRYDLRSAKSSDCFFNLGPTIASFCEHGKQPSSDLLITSVNTGAKTSPICFTSHIINKIFVIEMCLLDLHLSFSMVQGQM